MKKHGALIHDDWWTHTKEEYYKFVDQNVKDNAGHTPWSCHKTSKHLWVLVKESKNQMRI